MYRKKRGNKDCVNSPRFYSRTCEWVDDEGGSSEEGVTLRYCLQWAALTKRTKVDRDTVIIISSFNTPKYTFGRTENVPKKRFLGPITYDRVGPQLLQILYTKGNAPGYPEGGEQDGDPSNNTEPSNG